MGRQSKAEPKGRGKPGRPSEGLQNSAAQLAVEQVRAAEDLATACAQEYLDTKETARRLNVSSSYLNKARVTGDGPPADSDEAGHAFQ
jgi:hypothetical protein